MAKTSIEWCDFSVNPIRYRNLSTGKTGHYCVKVSPGCKNCYSSQMQKGPYLSGLEFVASNNGKGEHLFEKSAVNQVLSRRKPTVYFWCDMTDLFGEWVPTAWIARCFAAMMVTTRHTHITLTKRPERMCELLNMSGFMELVDGAVDALVHEHGPLDRSDTWPPPSWVAGTSCENQEQADRRIQWLIQTPAACRVVSAEPLLGPIDFTDVASEPTGEVRNNCLKIDTWDKPDWTGLRMRHIDAVIVGGESGPGARPCNVEWIRDIVRQCRDAGTHCFVKQLGANVYDEGPGVLNADPDSGIIPFNVKLQNRKGADPSEWPEDLRVRELPWITH